METSVLERIKELDPKLARSGLSRPGEAKMALAELKEQRRALMEGQHVKDSPGAGEACLVERHEEGRLFLLSSLPLTLLAMATGVRPTPEFYLDLASWNDAPERLTSEVIDAIDTAMAFGKDLLAELEESWAAELEKAKP